MVFSSQFFLFFFLPIVLAIYFIVPPRARNAVALAGSLWFYAWGAPKFIFVLLALCAVDYGVGRALHPASGRARFRWLMLGVVCNALGLIYFKYANFFVEQMNDALGALGMGGVSWTAVALPIGISFFTFQKISYLVDLHRGTAQPAASLGSYVLYVILFPQLIAGPIVRYQDVHDQLRRRTCTAAGFFSGMWRFCIGLGKKVLLANAMGEIADRLFDPKQGDLSSPAAWLGVLSYAFQIYYDFSGYSDMAIGMGRMMGFEFLENFRRPYLSKNFTEFWRRWHISLSTWMREYIYIPLGGSRISLARTYVNLWIVFLVSGFWHGASWSFVAWGAFHGFFLSVDKWKKDHHWGDGPRWVAIPVTFFFVCLSWVLFRCNTLPHALHYLGNLFQSSLFGFTAWQTAWSSHLDARAHALFILSLLLCFRPEGPWVRPPAVLPQPSDSAPKTWPRAAWQFAGSMALLFLSASALANSTFNPFIYFRF